MCSTEFSQVTSDKLEYRDYICHFTDEKTHTIVKFINCELILDRSLSLRGALCKHNRMEGSSLKVIFKNRKYSFARASRILICSRARSKERYKKTSFNRLRKRAVGIIS